MTDQWELLKQTATPADFATLASRGRWAFAPHLAKINRELVDIATGKNDRLIIQLPPRHGKSMLISQYGTAWFRSTFPNWNIMLTGATSDLAQRFSTRTRELVENWGHAFGLQGLDPRVQSWERWKLNGTGLDQGELYAAGIGGRNLMGSGCQLLLVDDYHGTVEEALSPAFRKRNYEWFLATSSSRLEPNGAVIVIATRWHNEDLIGMLLADQENGGERWRVVKMPAIDDAGNALWPQRWPLEKLLKTRAKYYARGYGWMWEALYQQQPPLSLDAEWPSHYFGDHIWYDSPPREDETSCKVMALDPSLGATEKADYSAYIMLTVGHDGLIYVDADVSRRDIVSMVNDGLSHYRSFRPSAWSVERNGFLGLKELIYEKSQGIAPRLASVVQHADKVARIKIGVGPCLESKRLRFRRGSPGVNLLVEQLQSFPSHPKKDGPDALETALRTAEEVMGVEELGLPERVYA